MLTICGLVLTLMLAQQVPRQRTPGLPRTTTSRESNTAAIATFNGKFKSADKKFLTIEVEEGQTMQMHITGSTKFVRDGKPAKAADFHADESVIVDASRDTLLNLLAVRVEAVAAKAAEPKAEK